MKKEDLRERLQAEYARTVAETPVGWPASRKHFVAFLKALELQERIKRGERIHGRQGDSADC